MTCLKCGDTGLIIEGDSAYRCDCWSKRLMDIRIKKSNLSVNFHEASFEKFNLAYYPDTEVTDGKGTYKEKAKKALGASKKFVDDVIKNQSSKGLFFCGPVGSGKTFLASAIARELLEENQEVLFLVVPDYLDAIRFTFDKEDGKNSEKELIDMASNVPVLILDDLGAHNYTQWTVNRVYSLLNFRLNHQLPTIITSNLDLSDLESLLGARTCSRIIGLCNVFRLLVPKDIRYIKSIQG